MRDSLSDPWLRRGVLHDEELDLTGLPARGTPGNSRQAER
jgi:hypothetical protein